MHCSCLSWHPAEAESVISIHKRTTVYQLVGNAEPLLFLSGP